MTRCLLLVWLAAGTAGCLEPTPDFVDPRHELLVDWAFDDPAAKVIDGAAPSQDLAIEGGEWVTSDGPPHLRFDGIDDFAVGPDLQDLVPMLETVTLEAHVRVDPNPDDWNPRPIVHVPQSSTEGTYALALTVYSAGRRLELGLAAGDEYVQVNRDHAYDDGQWLTLHGVYDGEQASLYLDGERLVDPVPLTGTLEGHDFDFNDQTIRVGTDGKPDDHLAFALSSLRIYGRPLEPGEIAFRAEQLSRDDPPASRRSP